MSAPASVTTSPASRFRPVWALALAYLALSAVLRGVLWARFGAADGVTSLQLPPVLLLGALGDLLEASYLFLPLALYLAVVGQRFHRSRAGRRLLAVLLFLMLYGLMFLGVMEYFFFEEFDARFNLVAVDYLIYPTEVIGDIRAEYPVGSVSLALFVAAALLLAGLWPRLDPRATGSRAPSRRRRGAFAGGYAFAAVLTAMTWNADSLSPFDNRVANELAANGVASFFAALRTNQIDYTAFYRTEDPVRARQVLTADLRHGGGEFVDRSGADLTRRHAARADGLGKLNVVLLAEESFGAEFVGAYGDTRGLTPEFDALAREGVLFTRAYSTGTRTVRGLEAYSASFPPIPSESIVKRPGNEDIATWGRVMSGLGYHTSFLYGGYGTFDNMNYFFGHNGFALSDRAGIAHPRFANIWGVSDQDLFRHALDYFDARAKEGRPFFSIVMSTSNHKPYTLPQGIPGIKPKGGGRAAGIRYADYAIGEFFREARRRDWFRDTVFIVAADHGARAYGKAEIPLYSYEIPVLILAPAHLAARRVDTLFSQIDLAPTVLALLGQPYEAPFFGQDVLHWPQEWPRTLLFNHNHDVAALQGNDLCILGLHKTADCVRYERTPGAPGPATSRFEPEATNASLVELATAYYQTGYELFHSRRYR